MKDRIIFRSVTYFYFVAGATLLLFAAVLQGGTVSLRSDYDIAVVISFIAIGSISIFLLAKGALHGGVSLYVIHWYFVLIFFFVVPFLQYLGNLFRYRVDSSSVLTGNVSILLWCLFYALSYDYPTKKVSTDPESVSLLADQSLQPHVLKHKFYVLTLVSISVTLYLVSIGGIESFSTRGAYNALLIERVGGWNPWGLVITFYLRPLLLLIFIFFAGIVFSLEKIEKTPVIHLCLLALFAANVIVNNPFSYARFMLFTIAFGLFVLCSLRRVKSSLVYVSLLFLGLSLFYVVDVFRQSYSGISRSHALRSYWDFLFRGHLDSYESFVHTISHVSRTGIVYGKQLVGALLFFVPRAFWTNKPVGSGTYIAEVLERKFDVVHFNISNPLISEMYLNFHIAGIIAGALFYGTVTGWLDKHYWMSMEKDTLGQTSRQRSMNFYRLLYPFLLGLYLFHLRGDFMSSFAYGVGFVLAAVTVVAFLKLRIAR